VYAKSLDLAGFSTNERAGRAVRKAYGVLGGCESLDPKVSKVVWEAIGIYIG